MDEANQRTEQLVRTIDIGPQTQLRVFAIYGEPDSSRRSVMIRKYRSRHGEDPKPVGKPFYVSMARAGQLRDAIREAATVLHRLPE